MGKYLLTLVLLIACVRFETAQSASENVSDAVAELLTPFLSEMREMRVMMGQMVNNITTIESNVRELTGSVTDLKRDVNEMRSVMLNNQSLTDLERKFEVIEDNLILEIKSVGSITERVYEDLSEVNKSLSGTVGAMEREMNAITEISTLFQRHSNKTKSELIDLHSSVRNLSLAPPTVELGNAVVQMLLPYMNETEETLCAKIEESNDQQTNQLLWYFQSQHPPVETLYECGGTGGWRRVVYLDMTDPNTNCPSNWNLTSYSKRTCGKSSRGSLTCDSVFFPVSGGPYNSVCGRIKAYQYGHIDAFESYNDRGATTIDEAYVSGVSLTHGKSPRQHIWTFAAGSYETDDDDDACPCDTTHSINIPSFVGSNYFCESGVNSGSSSTNVFYPNDPLWDGMNCSSSSTCCSLNNPPYFTKQLPSTSNSIEARICLLDGEHDDSPVEFLELYVKDTNSQQTLYQCGGTGGWRRVVYLNMTDTNTNCPSNWTLTSHSKRTCGKSSSGILTCDSAVFPVSGGPYNSVCGSIRAYQHSHTDAFEAYNMGRVTTIDESYVSGISLTHGYPRHHIWTFAAGSHETDTSDNEACPCDSTISINIPSFVGSDYFCESGVNSGSSTGGFHPNDTLWDGMNCRSSSTCCSFNNPPYFTKRLSSLTSDDLEARDCQWGSSDDSPVEFLELYVKDTNRQQTSIQTCPPQQPSNTIAGILRRIDDQIETTLAKLQTNASRVESKLDSLDMKHDELNMKLMEMNSELEMNITEELQKTYKFIQTSIGTFDVNNVSCDDTPINDVDPTMGVTPTTCTTTPVETPIETLYECGGTGGWRRVVYLNMTDPNTNCPSNWTLTSYSKRTCGRASSGRLTCDSVVFPVSGGPYNSVCGSIRAYQYGHIDAFEAYHGGSAHSINQAYVAGVSLTHGSPRQHIWTFAAGASEALPTAQDACPCDVSINISIPLFVGSDYFCESGVNSGSRVGFHPNDPLWDGMNCRSSSTCCSFNNPPYFTKQLPSTSNSIEARICLLDGGEDSPVEFIELYVKDTNSQHTPTQTPPTHPPTPPPSPQQPNPNTIAGILRRIESKQDELKNKITKQTNETQDLDTELGKMDGFLHNSLDKMDGFVCGGTGGWRRVFCMNMSDPNTNCPSGWRRTSHSKRTCGRARTGRLTCDSVHFPVSGGPYTSVCGSIKAYQYGNTDAFKAHHNRLVTNINGAYVTGISLTHGNPRQHIWTFAAGSYETDNDIDSCPCDTSTIAIRVPTFIEGDYFCESGATSSSNSGLHLHDPLWDGNGCRSPSTCCSFNGPPYFTKQLRMFTSNAIEARLCLLDSSDDVPVEFMELYVK